jgi:V/A-type H+-transporting ATPase subunit E
VSYRELIQSLRSDGENTVNQLWSEVRETAEKINTGATISIEESRSRYKESGGRAIKEQEAAILSQTKKKAQLIRLTAEKALSDRLFPIAQSLLKELRDKGYADVFASLVKELPSSQWAEVQVNPLDVEHARRHFPGTEITSDEGITGGMVVVGADQRVYIVNSFEKRLERAWEDLLPLLIKEAYKEVTACEHT